MRKSNLTLFFLAFLASTAFSQTAYKLEKWGKVQDSDLKMTLCDFDSSASSMVLQEVGSYELTYTRDGWRVEFSYRNRVKIFDESALDKGNLRIVYRSDREMETFKDLDVQLILPSGEVQKVKSDNVFTEQVNKYLKAKKVFIPNLQKGCIVEYRYVLQSADIYSLYDTWYFQQDMPVRWSQLKTTIPQYFSYVYLMQSNRKFDLNENTQESVTPAFGSPYSASITTYGMANLPAIKNEPYITTLSDYRAYIGFQLSGIYFPGRSSEKIMTSWPELAKKMTENEDFGGQFTQSKNFDKIWTAFRKEVPESTPKAELPEKVLRFVSSNIKWNGENRRYSENGLDKAFVNKTGSSSDLNLSVIALLRKLDFDIVPLLISTRDHGQTYNIYPFSDQFNTVVGFLYEGGGGILLDATNPLRPLGQMRGECYNLEGWLVDEKRPNWVQLSPPEYSETWFGKAKINEEGELSGHFTMVVGGPAATSWRSDLEGKKEDEFIKEHFASDYPDRSFDSLVISDRTALEKPLKVDFSCKILNTATIVNDFIYVKPVLDFFVTQNPLKSVKRSFPVDFTYPIKSQYVLLLDIPQGYTVEELPAPVRFSLPNEAGKLQFSCSKISNNQLQINMKMNIAQLEFMPDEYAALRQFFELMTEKVQFQLAMKKQ